MRVRRGFGTGLAAIVLLVTPHAATVATAQARLAAAKSIRCSFAQTAVGTWKKDGVPDVTPAARRLELRYEAIDADDGTAQLRNGSMTSDVIVRASPGYLHFMQVFRTGPLYTTTVFDKDPDGRLKAVHSRHEYFTLPLPGTTSSPEQYYGECEVLP